jgi:hypothetical protein
MVENDSKDKINFCVVYAKTKKKIDKYFKVNRIRNKYVIDIKKLMNEELENKEDKMFLKILIFNKVQAAIEKKKDVYFIPNFNENFSITKLLELKKILGDNNFNILLFYNEFDNDSERLDEALENLSKFTHTQILNDY